MAGGDVKLLTVLGLWLGAETMWSVTPFIIVAGGVIGVFYLALNLASSSVSIAEHVRSYAVQKVTPGWKNEQPLVIPFAPAIVIGLAYYFYIH
jgi:prepilin peptidase CpaA